jgi:hypothetical protein
MSERRAIERRPDSHGRNSRPKFPAAWGDPPEDREERRAWARANIKKGEELRARGISVGWLAPKEQR